MRRFVVIVQARENSVRLPKKVIKILNGKPLIKYIIERIESLNLANLELRFAIPNIGNDTLNKLLVDLEQRIYRGDEYDVLNRYISASKDLSGRDWIIRLTADNPFVDHDAIASIVKTLSTTSDLPHYAYATGLPLGMGFELFQVEKLREISLLAKEKHQREHVTVYFREHKLNYIIKEFPCYPQFDFNYHEKQIRLTIDEQADFQMAQKVLQQFKNNIYFNAGDILKLFNQQPNFFLQNLHIHQKLATSSQNEYKKN